MAVLGIDVNYYHGNIDWVRIKNSGVKFAILRLGYTGYRNVKKKVLDPMFEIYYKNAKAVGLPIGVYYCSRAVTVEEGENEAKFVIEHLKDKQLEYPVYITVEDRYYQAKANKINLTNAIKSFCDILEENNYYVGIYTNWEWLNNKLEVSVLDKYDKWLAEYSNDFNCTYGMWQLANTGNIGGLTNVKLNYAYKNFPFIMVIRGLNGYRRLLINTNKKTKLKLIFKITRMITKTFNKLKKLIVDGCTFSDKC